MLQLDHVGIACADLDQALSVWKALGAEVTGTEVVESQQVRVAFLDTGQGKTELLEPTGPESPIQKFLDSGRKGIHHIAYRVDNIRETLDELKARDIPLIHSEPFEGSRSTLVAFVHPKGTGGVLLELVEYTE